MEKKQKNIAINLVIILLILITLTSSIAGIYAWAKYTSSINGTATAQVAKWSFKLVDGVTETTDVIDFAITRTDGYGKVVEGRLAPGTFGEFEIGIDARGTETILEYIIDVELENKPTYLKLYSDEDKTKEILVEDNKFQVKGFMSLEDVKEIRTETIYWDWPYENGDDVTDTNDAGKTVTMKISVTGYEVLKPSQENSEEPIETQNLAEVVNIGDYVNYNANDNGEYSYQTEANLTGSGTITTFNSSDTMQWRVLSIDKQKGTVQLMSAEPTQTTLTLMGGTGFANAETVLDKIGAIYGNGKGATGGRSLTLEDINQYSSFDKTTYTNENGFDYKDTQSYTSGNFYKEIIDSNGNITGYSTSIAEASSSNPITMTQTYYDYSAKDYLENIEIYNMIFKKCSDVTADKNKTWLASRSTNLSSGISGFRIYVLNSGDISYNGLYNSQGNYSGPTFCVSIVVTLETNIQTTGQDANGVWQLKVD